MKPRLFAILLTLLMPFAVAEQIREATNRIEVDFILPVGFPENREAILTRSVGIPIVKKYRHDDGYGFNFRKDQEPDFKLEFRKGHLNVSWVEFYDNPGKFGKLNDENNQLAEKVLTVALGSELAKKILEYKRQNQPVVIRTGRATIYFSVAGGYSNLVMIHPEN